MRRMGGITELLGMMPGGAHQPRDIDEKEWTGWKRSSAR